MRNDRNSTRRRFYRDRTNGKIAGVCAGLADYFGFDLTVTRVLAVIALIVAPPATLLLYFGLAFLVPPAEFPNNRQAPERREFRQSLRSQPRTTVTDVKRMLLRLDARLARLERYVTSPRYNLEKEISEL